MHHFGGLTGGEAGSDGSAHSWLSGDDPSAAHTLGGEHSDPAAGSTPFAGHGPFSGLGTATGPHIGDLPGGLPDPALAAGLHSVTASVTNVTVDISNQSIGHHAQAPQPDKQPGHDDGLLSHAAGEWLGPAALIPVLGDAGRMLQKWVKRRLTARNVDDLADRLDQGDRVVAVVEADELARHGAGGRRLGQTGRIPGQGAEVPVEVVSVNRNASSGGSIVVDDDDGPLGRQTVPIEVFDAAWQLADRLAYTLRQEAQPAASQTLPEA